MPRGRCSRGETGLPRRDPNEKRAVVRGPSANTVDLNQACGSDLGPLNPLLYQIAGTAAYTKDFHDVTLGNDQLPYPTAPGYPAGALRPADTLGHADRDRVTRDVCPEGDLFVHPAVG